MHLNPWKWRYFSQWWSHHYCNINSHILMKPLNMALNDCILISSFVTSKSLLHTEAKWSNLLLRVSFYFIEIVICMRLCLLDSHLSRLWFPKNGKHNPSIVARVRLYIYTHTHTVCVTSLQFPTMSHSISYLKFTGAYVWVCPVGTNSAIVEEQETAETGPTKHRQMTR